jgi:crotonobetainyl-CoA:carnitine CoA-transferase CaiB-like acyl-CoA transferase
MEAFGLSPARLHAANPRLVIVRISGWGQTGPYAERPGFGTLVEAFSGFAQRNGFPDKPPALPNLGLADMIAGLSGRIRHARRGARGGSERRTGAGRRPVAAGADARRAGPGCRHLPATGKLPRRLGNRAENAAPRNAYLCSDGHWLVMSGSTQRMAERVLAAIGRSDLVRDERYLDNTARIANVDSLDEMIGGFIAKRTLEENLAHFGEHEVTVGPMLNADELMQDPHVQERQVLVEVPDPELGSIVMHNVFPRLSRTPGSIRSTAPKIGQDQGLVDRSAQQQSPE